MKTRPLKEISQFLGKTIQGFNADGSLLWEGHIKAIQKVGKGYKDGYFHVWLDIGGQVTGNLDNLKRWTL